jgi:HPt (histidine-containing phosphotransfer) domain-containing protein
MQPQMPGEAQLVLDADDLMGRCLGNLEFAERILAMFQTRFGEDLGELERMLAAGDAESVAYLSHRLKGAAANAAAPSLKTLAAEIEQLARARSLDGVQRRLDDLRHEWDWFRETALLWKASSISCD